MSFEICLSSKCCGQGYSETIKLIKYLKDNKCDVTLKKGHPSQFKDILIKNGKDVKARESYVIIGEKVFPAKSLDYAEILKALNIVKA